MRVTLAKLGLLAWAAMMTAGPAQAAQCGNSGAGFEAWKSRFSAEAKASGIGRRGLQALAGTAYATRTIRSCLGSLK